MARIPDTWSPLRELNRLHRDVNDLLDRAFGVPSKPSYLEPPVESFVENHKLVVLADLPGIDPKEVDISVEGNILKFSATRRPEPGSAERQYLVRELRYGTFARSLELPDNARGGEVKAVYRAGVLQLTIPLVDTPRNRKIPIRFAKGEDR